MRCAKESFPVVIRQISACHFAHSCHMFVSSELEVGWSIGPVWMLWRRQKSLDPDGSQAAISRCPTHSTVSGQFSHNFSGETSAIRCSQLYIYHRRSDLCAHTFQTGLVEVHRNIQRPNDWWHYTRNTKPTSPTYLRVDDICVVGVSKIKLSRDRPRWPNGFRVG